MTGSKSTNTAFAMPRLMGAWCLVLGFLVSFAGCDDPAPTGDVCTAGQQIQCFCPDGRRGAQRCLVDGSQYSTCLCDGQTGRRDGGPRDTNSGLDAADTPPDTGRDDPREEPDPMPDVVEGSVEDEPDAFAEPDESTGPDIERLARLGEDCDRAASCETDICLGLTLSGTFHSVCATPCCHEEECPSGYGCLQAGAGRYCLPSRIFPASFTFDRATGEPCSDNPNACQSGICDQSANRCRGTCCTDDECISAPCHWSSTGSSLRLWCDGLGLLASGLTGSPCSSEFDCIHGICAASGDPLSYRCAEPCCGPSDCFGGTMCGLVAGIGGAVVRACVENPTGGAADGTPCSDDGESCAGGHCIEGACRRVCCVDADCAGGMRCLPRTYEDVLVPVCTRPDE